MKRSRFNEEQIISILKEQEAGLRAQAALSVSRLMQGNVRFGQLRAKSCPSTNHPVVAVAGRSVERPLLGGGMHSFIGRNGARSGLFVRRQLVCE
jgi:hypothetical protein